MKNAGPKKLAKLAEPHDRLAKSPLRWRSSCLLLVVVVRLVPLIDNSLLEFTDSIVAVIQAKSIPGSFDRNIVDTAEVDKGWDFLCVILGVVECAEEISAIFSQQPCRNRNRDVPKSINHGV